MLHIYAACCHVFSRSTLSAQQHASAAASRLHSGEDRATAAAFAAAESWRRDPRAENPARMADFHGLCKHAVRRAVSDSLYGCAVALASTNAHARIAKQPSCREQAWR